MIRTGEWKLIYTKGDIDRTDGYETAHPRPGKTKRLYHVSRDPQETTDLAARPQYQRVVRQLEQKLYERLVRTQPQGWRAPPGLSREETIDLLLRPIEGKQAEKAMR